MNISLRIRREYFDRIASGTKNHELRADSEYWRTRFERRELEYVGGTAVFVCGSRVLRRLITHVFRSPVDDVHPDPLSEQGRKDIPTDECWVICLGARVL